VAIEYLRRATLCETTIPNLSKHGRAGEFHFGVNADGYKAPLRTVPVDRSSFQAWVSGNGKAKR
jgi:hypothetical protein